jgi:hypothetical protein
MAQHSPKISELVKLPGVGHGIAEKLVDAGVTTPVKLTMASIDTLCKAGMAENTAKKIREEAKKQVQARRDEKAESSEQPIFAYRFPCIMKTLPDGSKDVDWANLQEQAKERGTDEMRGVYIHCTALSGQRDLPWKVGKTKKVILDRIQTGDNKLLVRDILSDYNYNEKCNKDYVFYFACNQGQSKGFGVQFDGEEGFDGTQCQHQLRSGYRGYFTSDYRSREQRISKGADRRQTPRC